MGITKKAIVIGVLAIGVYLLKQYMNGGVCNSNARLDGKTVIITGANTGIGKETAIDFVNRGGKVIMACRSEERGLSALQDVLNVTGAAEETVVFMKLDLGSLKSIREFVKQYKSREKRLDILVNNAGVMWVPFSKTEDGFETTFGVNHLGHFLLTNLLMDYLVASKPSRVVTVSSKAHERSALDFDNLYGEKEFGLMSSYGQSKTANILFSKELSNRMKDEGVTTYSLHPGAIRTELGRHIGIFDYAPIRMILFGLLWPYIKEPWNGAQTTICCAVDEKLAVQSGKYYSDCAVKAPMAYADDDAIARKLWDISIDMVGLKPEETHPNLRKK